MTAAAHRQPPGSTAVVTADTAGRIIGWNDAATHLFGHDHTTALESSLDLIVPPDYRERHWTAFHTAMTSGECRFDRAAIHLPVLCADHTVRVYAARFTFITDAHGNAAGATATYTPASDNSQPFERVTSKDARG